MHFNNKVPVWKQAPFIRLLLPFIVGILWEWYFNISLPLIVLSGFSFTAAYTLFYYLPLSFRFKIGKSHGMLLNMILLTAGLFLTWEKDIRNSAGWYGNIYHTTDCLLVRINEPLTKKTRSYKTEGWVEAIIRQKKIIPCQGKLQIYFQDDSIVSLPGYGSRIIISKSPERIQNTGNPGSFDYEQYAAFQQVFHSVYLSKEDWTMAENAEKGNRSSIYYFLHFTYTVKDIILSILRKNIEADGSKLSLAEALLIGYTNDLDRPLLQAYTNTGVVHIIAISGMHLTLIYVMLVWIFTRIPLIRNSKWTQLFLILGCLWFFSIITGAGASVMRSAIMFSFVSLGIRLGKAASVYNSLAASAFVLLCYNPYLLWDVGFQLSYLAVAGILIFQKPVYLCLAYNYKWKDRIWKMLSVTLSAQVLTFPVCIYYFHQFPLLFLICNLIAIPLSSLILYLEIGLLIVSPVPFLSSWVGKITGEAIGIMNIFITSVNKVPYSIWNNIPASISSTCILYAIIFFISSWLIYKDRIALKMGLYFIALFACIMSYNSWMVHNKRRLIIYKVPHHQAIDFINGNNYFFLGDTSITNDSLLAARYLRPSRQALQLSYEPSKGITGFFKRENFIQFGDRLIVLINGPVYFHAVTKKVAVDIVIITGNPVVDIAMLDGVFDCRQYVFDASNSLWKIDKWVKECEELHLRSFSIPAQGAFIYDL